MFGKDWELASDESRSQSAGARLRRQKIVLGELIGERESHAAEKMA